MTAALLRWWTVPRLNVVIRTHPVLVRAVLQKNCNAGHKSWYLIFRWQRVPTLDDDEHVVDADAEEKEGDDVVHRPELELEDGADPEGDDEAHGDADDADDGQVDSLLQTVELAKHGHDVDEDN